MDADGNGTLSLDEFKVGLESLGIRINQGLIADSFDSLVRGGTGEIHFDDFQAWWAKNENRMRASAHDLTVNESMRDTQRRVSAVEESVGQLQDDMAKLLSILRSK